MEKSINIYKLNSNDTFKELKTQRAIRINEKLETNFFLAFQDEAEIEHGLIESCQVDISNRT
jgi:hypothetical protein